MKRLRQTVAFLLLFAIALPLASCGNTNDSDWRPNMTNSNVRSDSLCVKKVEGLPKDFIMGMDASCVPSLEASGVKYYDHDGVERDVYEILADNGINYIRVRIWNDPFDADGNGYGGGNCDIENAIAVGQRATKAGLKLLVNFHYSDFWADPSKQMVPKAWQGMSIDEKTEAVYVFTKDCLEKLMQAGVDIGMVQVGNETNGVLCGESASALGGWQRIMQLISAGSRAVREVCPNALVAVHFSNPEQVGTYATYSKNLDYYGVDYDVFASSYYPFWHGTLDNLAALLSDIANTYGKKVMVAETSYAYTPRDTDFFANTLGEDNKADGYSFTVQGQADLVRDVIDTVVNKTPAGIGVFYWEGTWIGVGTSSYEENLVKWEKYGSGWASSYASEYDPKDAGNWHGGCSVENQALFDERGRALESLKVFALVREGNLENAK